MQTVEEFLGEFFGKDPELNFQDFAYFMQKLDKFVEEVREDQRSIDANSVEDCCEDCAENIREGV